MRRGKKEFLFHRRKGCGQVFLLFWTRRREERQRERERPPPWRTASKYSLLLLLLPRCENLVALEIPVYTYIFFMSQLSISRICDDPQNIERKESNFLSSKMSGRLFFLFFLSSILLYFSLFFFLLLFRRHNNWGRGDFTGNREREKEKEREREMGRFSLFSTFGRERKLVAGEILIWIRRLPRNGKERERERRGKKGLFTSGGDETSRQFAEC